MSEVIGNKRVRLVRYDKKAIDNFSIESNMKIPNN
jgi:hypothetical protein